MTSSSLTESNRRSSGISRNTGPGTFVVATRNAVETYSPSRRALGTETAHFVIGRIRSTWFMSCSPPMSWNSRGAWPPMITSGMLARYAVATPVTASVSPGPAVTIATPGWPVTRAQPSAACAADCSWRTSTTPMPSSRQPS